jgi:hypothetical protein
MARRGSRRYTRGKTRCPESRYSTGAHSYTPDASRGLTKHGAARWWVCDDCQTVIEFKDDYPVAPRASLFRRT